MTTLFLIVIYLSFISLGLPDSLLGSAWPVLWEDINAPFGAAGIISMAIAGGTIISSLFSVRLIRKIGTGMITLISCILTASALVGFSFAPNMLWFLVFSIPLGIGAGSVDAALNHFVAENYEVHHMNWLHCFWGVGATAGPMIMSYQILTHSSWRLGYLSVAVLQFLLVFILIATLPFWKKVEQIRKSEKENGYVHSDSEIETTASNGTATLNGTTVFNDSAELSEEELPARTQTEMTGSEVKTSKKKLFHLTGVKSTLLAFVFYCGAETTVGLWGASYLFGSGQVTKETAAGWISLYYAGITLGRFLTGFISFKLSNRKLILLGQFISLIGIFLMLLPLPVFFSMVGLIFIGLGFAPIFPGLIHETPKRFGSENSANLIGYEMATAYAGNIVLPPLFGLLATMFNIYLFPFIILFYIIGMIFSTERVNKLLKPKTAFIK